MSLTLPIHVIVDPALLQDDPQRLEDLIKKLDDFSPVLEEIGSIVEEAFADNFDFQGYGTWAPLARSTWRQKDRLGYSGQPPLARSGDLYRALTQRDAPGHKFLVSANELMVGVYGDVIPYATYLATGTKWMPPRILINISPCYIDEIVKAVQDWLGGGDAVKVYADAPLQWHAI